MNHTSLIQGIPNDSVTEKNALDHAHVGFVAEQKNWPAFVRGEGSPYQASSGSGGTSSSSSSSSAAQQITTERVRFPSGASSTEFPAQLPPNMTVRYELGARNGQFLDVGVSPGNAPLSYRILNPDGTALLDAISVDTPYRGQLWQSGDHVIEVVNNGSSEARYNVIFGIE